MAAAQSLRQLRSLVRRYERDRSVLAAEGYEPQHVAYLLRHVEERGTLLSVGVEVFSAMTVEAFLNYYGVVRLGRDYFKAHLQRVGVTEKLALLLASCDRVFLSPTDTLWVVTRKLFDRRNELVHPKALEVNGARYPGGPVDTSGLPRPEPLPATAERSFEQMRQFFVEFSRLGTEVGPKGRHRFDLYSEPGLLDQDASSEEVASGDRGKGIDRQQG